MAKCTLCNSRKGKRKCKHTETFICSLCCGQTRTAETCRDCSFFSVSHQIRNYKNAPHFPLNMMANNDSLQNQANVIESSFCRFDEDLGNILKDSDILRITELLLDKYHFNDDKPEFKNKVEEDGYHFLCRELENEMADISTENRIKLIGTVYRSILRHDNGGRDYLEFIHQHVGIRVGSGIRAIKNFL